jgi:hypothetical protein
MRDRVLVAGFAVLAAVAVAPSPSAAQGPASTPSRTPDGRPSLEGVFSFSTITPLQRPDALSGKQTLTDEEAAAFEASENTRLNRDLFDPEKGAPSAGYAPRSQGGVLSYNEFWYERGNRLTRDKRTSLVVDPPSGKIPFTDNQTITYAFTVSDPNSYTQPWSAFFPLSRIQEPVYEYACHEGNYALTNILAGARAQEKAAGK